MKPRQPAIVLNSLLLALVLLCVAAVLGSPDGYVLAADRPAKEQAKSQDKPSQDKPSQDKPRDREVARGNEERKASPEKNPGASGGEKDTPAGPRPKATSPVVIQPQATATPAATVAVSGISVDDPCGASGTVSLTGPYSGTLSLKLTYHVTGTSDFVPTGATSSSTFSSETTSSTYSLPMTLPADLLSDTDDRVNTFRVEILSANPLVANMTAKSTSFTCDDPTYQATASPTPGTTSLPPITTATPSSTPVVIPSSDPTQTSTPETSPSATYTPTGTEAPIPSPTPTGTEVPAPSPAPSPTLTPTGVPVASRATRITPDNSSSADPGSEVVYSHVITNAGSVSDIKEVRIDSSLGWTTTLLDHGESSPLPDSDGDGLPDTGSLSPGESVNVVLRLKVPDGAVRAAKDVTTVTAFSAADSRPGASDSATDTTTVNGVITVSLSTKGVSLGDVSPTGSLPPNSQDLSSSTDALGAYYTKSPAVRVTVNSNAAWTSTLSARENSGSASTIRITDGDLEWRFPGAQDWTDFYTSPSSLDGGSPGTSTRSYDYRLRVLWDDDPGSFAAVVTYDVTQ